MRDTSPRGYHSYTVNNKLYFAITRKALHPRIDFLEQTPRYWLVKGLQKNIKVSRDRVKPMCPSAAQKDVLFMSLRETLRKVSVYFSHFDSLYLRIYILSELKSFGEHNN